MYWHCFRASNLLNHWLVWQVHLELQLVPEKQEELIHTFTSLLGRKNSEEGREEFIFYLLELILKGLKMERIVWEVGKKGYL